MFVRGLLAAVALIVLSGPALAMPPQALVLYAPSDDTIHCFESNDRMLLLVVDNSTLEIARYPYCSSYGDSSAKVYVDERDQRRLYVVIAYGVGRGTNVTSDMLKIMTVDNDTASLHELANVVLREPDSPTSRWFNDFYVVPDIKGGLIITLMYAPGPQADPCCAPPEKQITIRVAE